MIGGMTKIIAEKMLALRSNIKMSNYLRNESRLKFFYGSLKNTWIKKT